MALHLNILKTILTLQENLHIIQDQAALHVIFPTLKALALNISFSLVENSRILYLIAFGTISVEHYVDLRTSGLTDFCITDKFIFKNMIKGTLWNRLRSAHISEYIFY